MERDVLVSIRFPPHSRGWTLPVGIDAGGCLVSPALAGMDPPPAPESPRHPGFPRTRGDGPLRHYPTSCAPAFPPHSRGWTHWLVRVGLGVGVSPALAGMDPERRPRLLQFLRFPRTRGDGPPPPTCSPGPGPFPPHSRGWTPHELHLQRTRIVSPALAGMDRRRSGPRPSPRGFPRTRGDGPDDHRHRPQQAGFPPHSRGWTDLDFGSGRGSPVSPALAGMDLAPAPYAQTRRCFPRTRGDGPWTRVRLAQIETFPPHSRGWTRTSACARVLLPVSPALAGMDPPNFKLRHYLGCFPRTRGDGPSPHPRPGPSTRFPPHSRGWTSPHLGVDIPEPFPPHSRGWTQFV